MLQSASTDTKKATARGNSNPSAIPAALRSGPVTALGNQSVLRLQRKCDCSGDSDCNCDMGADKKKKEKESPRSGLHRSAAGSSSLEMAPPIVHETLRSRGQTLDPETRAFFESRFSRDLSDVRIHTDSRAAQSARAVNAHAYTVGSNIAFASGKFDPGTIEGRRLLAHELVHTLQQPRSLGPAALLPQTSLVVGAPGDRHEQEADQVADRVVRTPDSAASSVQPRQANQQQPAAPSSVTAGNRLSPISTRRMQRQTPPAPAGFTPTVNVALKPVTDLHPTPTPAQTAALQTLDVNASSVWTNLDWATVSVSAAKRVFNPEMIDQSVLGLCGPAAALNGEALQAPDSFAQLVVTLFQTGKIGKNSVNDTLKAGTPPTGMDQADWMMMSALQDINNTFYQYYGKNDKAEENKRGGQPTGQVEDDLKATGCVATTTYSCFYWGVISAAEKANKLLQDHPADTVVIMFVSAGLLTAKKDATSTPDHFIRVLKSMAINEVEVKFDAFTWGSNRSFQFNVPDFEKLVSAFIVGTRNKDVSL